MSLRLPLGSAVRKIVAGLPALVGLLLSGCGGEGYPETLTYPARTDPVVIGKATQDAPSIDRPGEFPNVLFANLPAAEKDKLLLDPEKVQADDRNKINHLVTTVFGTPAKPSVNGATGDHVVAVVEELRTKLGLDDQTLARGSNLYRQQCLHCHGLTGDGRGPTSPWVNPHPRDYRQGVFKFTSSIQAEGARKPRKDDLTRTIREGIEGTSMPSFRLLGDEEIDALASYVIHLSFRGQVEFLLLKDAADGEMGEPERTLVGLARFWLKAQDPDSLVQPDSKTIPTYTIGSPQHKESALRGFKLFTEQKEGGCISCHLDYGRQSSYKYDFWGTITRPADVTVGIYRGGRRPIDLFNRIHSGINGSGMTAFSGSVRDDQIWDLVSFLQVVPYPNMRKAYGIKLEAE